MSQVSEIWMFIFDNGSVSDKEIGAHLNKPRNLFHPTVRSMENKEQICRIPRDYENKKSRVKFTVTGECVIPAGIKLKEILK